MGDQATGQVGEILHVAAPNLDALAIANVSDTGLKGWRGSEAGEQTELNGEAKNGRSILHFHAPKSCETSSSHRPARYTSRAAGSLFRCTSAEHVSAGQCLA